MTKLAVLEVLPIVARRMALERDRPGARSYDWPAIARPNQLAPPGDWRFWLILTGRGWGKTRTGSEWIREQVRTSPYVNIIGATADDARDIMIEGESGILAVCPDRERPDYLPSKRRLEWPNGARSLIFTADEPERLRGKQHTHLWGDEIAAWRYQESFDQAMFGLRLGPDPRGLFTSTPKPVKAIKALMADPNCVITRGTTYENRDNLAAAFYEQVVNRYEGTRLGRQELAGELLEDVEGALWSLSQIDALRVHEAPDLSRIVVAIDPAVTHSEDSDETGIVVAGVGDCDCMETVERHGFVLADLSGRYSPDGWARRVIGTLDSHHADRIIAEVNNGGEMVEQTLRTIDPSVPYKAVHASRGKVTRAEPVAALYEQCLARGTQVETARGSIPIEQVATSDHVWTRAGLRRVLWSGQTGIKPTVELRAGSLSLRCTSDHPVFTANRGFVHAGLLASTRDIILVCDDALIVPRECPVQECAASPAQPVIAGRQLESRSARMSCLRAPATIDNLMDIGALGDTPEMSYSIARYGARQTAQSPKGGMSTIAIMMPAITRPLTSKRLSRPSMVVSLISTGERNYPASVARHLPSAVSGGAADSPSPGYVASAVSPSSPSLRGFGFARQPATRPIGIDSVEPGPILPVHNLTVEGEPEFFANGILVHNCKVHHVGSLPALEDQMTMWTPGMASPDRMDALVWALTELMVGARTLSWA